MSQVVESYGIGKHYRNRGPALISPQQRSRPWRKRPDVATVQAQSADQISAFLSVPFKETLRSSLRISQGWQYDAQERSLHPKIATHKGCDFRAKIWEPVLAAADGVALSSHHFAFLDDRYNRSTKSRDMQSGARMAYGLGNFVVIWHPEPGVFTLYAHLQEINRERVPYFTPVQDGEKRNPKVIMQSVEAMMASTNDEGYYPQPVLCGDMIGIVGVSGLSLECDGESPGFIPDQRLYPTWDPAGAHLHFEVYTRKPDGSGRELRLDPWGIYDEARAYRDVLTTPTRGLFLSDPATGWPQFAG